MKTHFVPQVKTRRQRYWTTLALDRRKGDAVALMEDACRPRPKGGRPSWPMGRVLRVTMDHAPEVMAP